MTHCLWLNQTNQNVNKGPGRTCGWTVLPQRWFADFGIPKICTFYGYNHLYVPLIFNNVTSLATYT